MLARWITALTVSASPSSTTGLRERKLARVRPGIAGDAVGAVRLHVLQRELDVIEPRLLRAARGGQRRARSPR